MVKQIKKVTKRRSTRERKRIIVVGAEGDNKSEIQYFQELEKTQSKFHFIVAPGTDTDPVRIVRKTANKAKQESLDYRHGDMAISIFDLDQDQTKRSQLEAAKELAKKKKVAIVTSNPCFEVWYLEHFGYTSKPFLNSDEAIKELKKRLPEYKKSNCDFDVLYPNTEAAIKNCEKLILFHESNGVGDEFANPRTDVHKIVRMLVESTE